MAKVESSDDIEAIFRKYKDKVYRLALNITRNEKEAEDIMQNTFLQIMKNLQNFRHESKLSTWIYKIAYNEALMALRKRSRLSRLTGSLKRNIAKETVTLFVNWSKLPDEQLLEKELKNRIDNAIGNMPIKYRMPLLLSSVEGLPLKDSASILKLKENSLKTRLHRSRMMIKSEISNYAKDLQEKTIPEPPQCKTWIGFLYNYAVGNLGRQRQHSFNLHIKDCSGCKSFLKTYVQAIKITKNLQCQDLPPSLQQKIETFLSTRHLKIKKKEAEKW